MDARNQEYEGDQRCTYAVHINNNTIRKESQNPICEVLARSSWRAGLGQEASDGSKVRREGKAGPFIPCEVRAQTELEWATTLAVARKRRRETTAVGARAKAYPLGGRRLCLGDDRCRVGGVFFHKHPKLQRSGDDVCRVGGVIFQKHRKLQRSSDDVCVRATTHAPVQRRLPHGRGDFSETLQTSALRR